MILHLGQPFLYFLLLTFLFQKKSSLCVCQHIFNKNSVARRRVVDKHVCDRSDKLAVLNYRRAAHERVNIRTTHFNRMFTTTFLILKKQSKFLDFAWFVDF